MNSGGLTRKSSLRLQVPHADTEALTIETVKEAMKYHLTASKAHHSSYSHLDTLQDLPSLIQQFAQISASLYRNILPAPPSVLQKELAFYKER